jgi:hypothetical protein
MTVEPLNEDDFWTSAVSDKSVSSERLKELFADLDKTKWTTSAGTIVVPLKEIERRFGPLVRK